MFIKVNIDPVTINMDWTEFTIKTAGDTQFLSMELSSKKGDPPEAVIVRGRQLSVEFSYSLSEITTRYSTPITIHKYVTSKCHNGKRVILLFIEPITITNPLENVAGKDQ